MNNTELQETIDTRWVFRTYALLAGLGGFVLFGWGPVWLGIDLPGLPFGKAALVRVFGAVLMAAACMAVPYAMHGTPSLRAGLFWFGAAHAVVFGVMKIQQTAIWGPGIGQEAGRIIAALALVFLVLFAYGVVDPEGGGPALTGIFGGRSARAAVRLRSEYERKIQHAARQEERNRLARDLHDSIKQQVFVIQTAAATAQARFEGDQAGVKQALDQIRDSAREAMTEMQAMLDQLRAEPLTNTGLIEALKKQCEALQFRSGAKVEFTFGELPKEEAMAPGAQEAILRVAQEALANVGRHARAGAVKVSLAKVCREVKLRVEDDGAGFDTNQDRRGLGLGNMQERAAELGGTMELSSQPGRGTAVVFAVPYASSKRVKERRWAWLSAIAVMVAVPVSVWSKPGAITIFYMVAVVGLTRAVVLWFRTRPSRAEKEMR